MILENVSQVHCKARPALAALQQGFGMRPRMKSHFVSDKAEQFKDRKEDGTSWEALNKSA